MNVNKTRSSQISILLSLVIIGLSVWFRFWQFGQVPSGYYWDEVAHGVDAMVMTNTGLDMHGHSLFQPLLKSYGDYKAPVLTWLTALLGSIFFNELLAVRVVSALMGLITSLTIFLIVRQLYAVLVPSKQLNKSDYVVICAAACTTPWLLFFSRVGFESFIGQSFLYAGMLAFIQAHLSVDQKRRLLFAVIAGLLIFFSSISYITLRYLIPVVLITVSAALYFILRPRFADAKWHWLIPTVVAVFCFGVAQLWLVSHPLYTQSQAFRQSTPSLLTTDNHINLQNQHWELTNKTAYARVMFNRRIFWFRELLSQLGEFLTFDTLVLSADSNLRHSTGMHGLLFISQLGLLLLGMLFSSGFKERLGLIVCFVLFICGLIPAAIPHEVPHAMRSLGGLVPLSVAVGLSGLILIRANKRWLLNSLLGFLLVELVVFNLHYFGPYSELSAQAWQADYGSIAQAAVNFDQAYETILVIHPDDRFYLWLLATNEISPEEIIAAHTASSNPKLKSVSRYIFAQSVPKDFNFLSKQAIVSASEAISEQTILAARVAGCSTEISYDQAIIKCP